MIRSYQRLISLLGNWRAQTNSFLFPSRSQRATLSIVADRVNFVLMTTQDDERLVNDLVTCHLLIGGKRPDVQAVIGRGSDYQFVLLTRKTVEISSVGGFDVTLR